MAGNSEAGGFLNNAVRYRPFLHNPRACFPVRGFANFQELYQSNNGRTRYHEAGGFVKSTARVNYCIQMRIMEQHAWFNRILLVMMMMMMVMMMGTVCVTQTTVVQNRFRKLQSGQSIMGKTGAELKARSTQECVLK